MRKPQTNYDVFDREEVSELKSLIFKNESECYNSRKRLIALEKKVLRLEDRIIKIEKMCIYCNNGEEEE